MRRERREGRAHSRMLPFPLFFFCLSLVRLFLFGGTGMGGVDNEGPKNRDGRKEITQEGECNSVKRENQKN